MRISDSQRALMSHSALDLEEIQEVKRLWWNMHNVYRVFGDVFDTEAITIVLNDLETIAAYAAKR